MYVVDPYDDNRELLKSLSPSTCAALEKVGEDLSHCQQDLSDAEFALVMVQSGEPPKKFRKFACTDLGNILQSAWYLAKTAGNLPKEAATVAADNLVRCMRDMDLTPPEELQKLCSSEDPVPDTNLFLLSPEAQPPEPKEKRAGIPRTFDKAADIVDAVEAFYDHGFGISPWEKRAVAKGIVAARNSLDPEMVLPSVLSKYASDTYALDLPAAMHVRQCLCIPQDDSEEAMEKAASDAQSYRILMRRHANLSPTEFARELESLDKRAGIRTTDDRVPDAVYATFGVVKTAADSEEFLFVKDGLKFKKSHLDWLLAHRMPFVESVLGEMNAGRLAKNPVPIFNSLPDPTKKILARQASQKMAEFSADE